MEKITMTINLDKIQEDRAWEYNGARYISVTSDPNPRQSIWEGLHVQTVLEG